MNSLYFLLVLSLFLTYLLHTHAFEFHFDDQSCPGKGFSLSLKGYKYSEGTIDFTVDKSGESFFHFTFTQELSSKQRHYMQHSFDIPHSFLGRILHGIFKEDRLMFNTVMFPIHNLVKDTDYELVSTVAFEEDEMVYLRPRSDLTQIAISTGKTSSFIRYPHLTRYRSSNIMLYDFVIGSSDSLFFSSTVDQEKKQVFGLRHVRNLDFGGYFRLDSNDLTERFNNSRFLYLGFDKKRIYLSSENNYSPLSDLFNGFEIQAAINNNTIYFYDNKTVIYLKSFQTIGDLNSNPEDVYWSQYGMMTFAEWIGCSTLETPVRENLKNGILRTGIPVSNEAVLHYAAIFAGVSLFILLIICLLVIKKKYRKKKDLFEESKGPLESKKVLNLLKFTPKTTTRDSKKYGKTVEKPKIFKLSEMKTMPKIPAPNWGNLGLRNTNTRTNVLDSKTSVHGTTTSNYT